MSRNSRKRTKRRAYSEQQVVELLIDFLEEDGYRVRLEVPNMGQCADVVGTRNRWVTFIEAKVRDWQRAVEQCRAHESVADYVCLALALKSIPSGLRESAERGGYGLILCDVDAGCCEWAIQPRRNSEVWLPQRRRLARAMKGIDHEC